ncbi:hypothetical protein [Streptomyces sp. SPB162]|uniref:ATP-grasp domain-containing protein n=1 Tax=Streptomyces sp. SPB162 TaxID=2940560 RepID=UPI002407761B|nr:hypothetical protein [Streptomyces sp. SPB162]MDF9814133.1 ribosomal protein S6--L-glutamate ligase [Streptomyces sp. SPB162]
MRLCFLVEEHYRHDGMPLDVVGQLAAWGHQVDVIRPGGSLIRLSEFSELSGLSAAVRSGAHDAWVLKTVSGGPGLTLLEGAAALGLTTINDARAIRAVRDKALTALIAQQHGLPMPVTYAAARPELFAEVPEEHFPLVVKPAAGSAGRGVRLVLGPDRLTEPDAETPHGPGPGPGPEDEGLLIAQPYVPNSGTDLKVYCVGGEVFAAVRASPLCPELAVDERLVPLPREVAELAAEIGAVFGLDLYGIDVLLGPDGPVVVDVNDFPSFRKVPDAVARVARAVLDLARTGGATQHPGRGALRPETVDFVPAQAGT